MDTPIRILLADDHRLFVECLKTVVDGFANCEVVATANSGDEALYQLRRFRTDVLVLDINMPGKDGLAVLDVIQRQQLPVGVLMLSSYDEPFLVKKCLKLGARGYLLKGANFGEFEQSIRSVAAGNCHLSSDLKRALAYRDDPYDRFTDKFRLTDRELSIVRLLTEDKTSDEIADQLCVSPHTIDATRKTLLKKLNVRSVAGIVSWAWRCLVV